MLSKIGQLCKKWRLSQGITQYRIALEVGCTQSNISHFEAGMNDTLSIYLWYVLNGFELRKDDLYDAI